MEREYGKELSRNERIGKSVKDKGRYEMNEENTVAESVETPKNTGNQRGKEAALLAAAFFVTLLLFIFLKPLAATETLRAGVVAQTLTAVCIAVCLCVGGYLAVGGKLTAKRALVLLLTVGFAVRVGYMLYTAASARQHDLFTRNGDGHEGYAWYIYIKGRLPASNEYQFYHPPLNALIQAWFMEFFELLSNLGLVSADAYAYGKPEYIGKYEYMLYSSCQVLSVFWSCLACAFCVKIVRLFSFSDKTSLLLCAFVILYPRQVQFAGMLNNDPLAYACSSAALYYALKWWKQNRSLQNILLCALAVGAGMMSKLSSATVCLPIAGIFLWEGIASLRKEDGALPLKTVIVQYASFLAVCAPIGLWFQVYAKLRFDQPFGFVFSNLNGDLYTGDHGLFSRFVLCFDWNEYFGSLWCKPFDNYYLFHYALRSSLFGEFSYWQGEGFALVTLLTAYAAAGLLLVSLCYCFARSLARRKKTRLLGSLDAYTVPWKEWFFTFLLLQSQVISEMYFYWKMPYGCTMDFRYIMPMILAVALALGLTKKSLQGAESKTALALDRLLTVATAAFLIAATLFYCVCI